MLSILIWIWVGFTLFVNSKTDDDFCKIKNILLKDNQCLLDDDKHVIANIKNTDIINTNNNISNHIKHFKSNNSKSPNKAVGTKHTIKNKKTVKIGNKYVITNHINETIKYTNNTIILNNITNKTIIDEDITYYIITRNITVLLNDNIISNDIKKDVTKKNQKVRIKIVNKNDNNKQIPNNKEINKIVNKAKKKVNTVMPKNHGLKILLKGASVYFVINEKTVM